jgi:hypothetical protein
MGKDEFTRITEELKAIRRIAGAGPSQSAADAVAELAFAKWQLFVIHS